MYNVIVTKKDNIERHAVAGEGEKKMLDCRETKFNLIRKANGEEYLSNPRDQGRRGKHLELKTISLLVPHSTVTDIKPGGKTDIKFKIGDKFYYTEIKSESGEICKFTGEQALMDKRDLTLQDLLQGQKRDYMIYSIDATVEQARFVRTEDFFKILLAYPGQHNAMINWIDGKALREERQEGRLKVSVHPKGEKARRDYLQEAMQGVGISLEELVELRNQ